MITRVTNHTELESLMRATPSLTHVLVDLSEWIKDTNNVALEEDGSFGVFEYVKPGVYTGHYFFRARGKEAKTLALKMLELFFQQYEAKLIIGLTPTHHRGALWMNRQLGFKEMGETNTVAGPHKIFILTADEHKEHRT